MSMATIMSAGLEGIDAYPIHVELDITRGLPGWSMVGLAESTVRESKDRVMSAITNSGYEIPFRRITLNLAPAGIKKGGTGLDLPIALGLLAAREIIPKEALKGFLFLGELSLTGKLRPVRGVLSVAILSQQKGIKGLILPEENLGETFAIKKVPIWGAPDLPAVVEFLLGKGQLKENTGHALGPPPRPSDEPDFAEVKGQAYAKRALEVASSGFHNLLMVGPPGTGKSMLAQRLPSILPPMNEEESLATTKIYSLMGLLKPGEGLLKTRPYRAPHHTISDAGLIGGGRPPRPGEVSLAHNGVLFLDELTEFRKNVLESLRQPLENHQVTIARVFQSLTFPARFLLAAAMNPCPCGQLGNPKVPCLCPASQIFRYQSKISGPLLDRMDLQIQVPPLALQEICDPSPEEPSKRIRSRVREALDRQFHRFAGDSFHSNSQMGPKVIRRHCTLGEESEKVLKLAIKKWGLSARAYHRILKKGRTAQCWALETISVRFRRAA